jgi:hypothetical protein
MTQRQKYILAAVLAGGAALVACVELWPRPVPRPSPAAGLDLRGKWIGSDAAGDAAAFAGVCRAIADALEHDGASQQPRVATGLQLDDLRVATSEFRFAPRPLRDRQPHVRAAVGRYLDQAAGTSGGPLDPVARARWVSAFRELAQAAEEAVR